MKKNLLLPLVSLLLGAAAFLLRLMQNASGFEPETGLPVPGHFAGLALPILLAAAALVLLLLAFCLPGKADALAFPFPRESPRLPVLPVAGVLLLALSGLADLLEGFTGGNLLLQMQMAADPYAAEPILLTEAGFSPRGQLLLGLLTLVLAAALFPAVSACRKRENAAPFQGTLLLVPPVVLIVHLVMVYRLDSVNPVLEAYYPELLALVLLTLTLYRLSSFAFRAGKCRCFSFYSAMTVVLCLTALADGGPRLSSLLLCAGGAVTALGFLSLQLEALNRN